jgi:hypothetical protein
MNRVSIFGVAVLCLGLAFSPLLRAEYNNITQTDVSSVQTSPSTAASGTWTSRTIMAKRPDNPTTGLSRTFTQSAVVQAAGTSPNYKVEVLCSMDGITFVKPEVGGDLGTFTDTNPHFVPVQTPLSPGGHRFKFTELGGVNSAVWTVQEASQ